MTFKRYDVVVVPFPFTDKNVVKKRPVVILTSEEFLHSTKHAIVAMITSAKNSDWLSDIAIKNYRQAGLTVPCVIRMKIFTVDQQFIAKKIGTLAAAEIKRLQGILQNAILK